MSTLYQLTDTWRTLWELANDPEANDEELLAMLEILQGDIITKAQNTIKFDRSVETSSDMLDAEIKRLQKLKKRLENTQKRLRSNILASMVLAEESKIVTPLGTISLVKARESVEVYDVELLPDEYVKIERVPDKTAISKALKAGSLIAGATLKTGDPTITIR